MHTRYGRHWFPCVSMAAKHYSASMFMHHKPMRKYHDMSELGPCLWKETFVACVNGDVSEQALRKHRDYNDSGSPRVMKMRPKLAHMCIAYWGCTHVCIRRVGFWICVFGRMASSIDVSKIVYIAIGDVGGV